MVTHNQLLTAWCKAQAHAGSAAADFTSHLAQWRRCRNVGPWA